MHYGGGHLEPGYSEVALKVYNTTSLTDKYVRVSKIERIGDALQSIHWGVTVVQLQSSQHRKISEVRALACKRL